MDSAQLLSHTLTALVATGTVGVLFYICALGLRRLGLKGAIVTGQGSLFQVLNRQNLDAKSSILLIESQGRRYLLISNADGYRLLDKFENETK